jgi:hypothetical protein
MSPTVLVVLLSLLGVCATLLHVAVDRAARADAWQHIAEARRWNAEQRTASTIDDGGPR